MHPTHYVQMSSPDELTAANARTELSAAAAIFDRMGLDHDAVIVVHVGGVYGDPQSGCERFVRNYERLPQPVRARLVLENDDHKYSFEDCLWIHERTGVPLVLDVLHLRCLNPTVRPRGRRAGRCVRDLAGSAHAQDPLQQPAHEPAHRRA